VLKYVCTDAHAIYTAQKQKKSEKLVLSFLLVILLQTSQYLPSSLPETNRPGLKKYF